VCVSTLLSIGRPGGFTEPISARVTTCRSMMEVEVKDWHTPRPSGPHHI
jgi:hypothetical protein